MADANSSAFGRIAFLLYEICVFSTGSLLLSSSILIPFNNPLSYFLVYFAVMGALFLGCGIGTLLGKRWAFIAILCLAFCNYFYLLLHIGSYGFNMFGVRIDIIFILSIVLMYSNVTPHFRIRFRLIRTEKDRRRWTRFAWFLAVFPFILPLVFIFSHFTSIPYEARALRPQPYEVLTAQTDMKTISKCKFEKKLNLCTFVIG